MQECGVSFLKSKRDQRQGLLFDFEPQEGRDIQILTFDNRRLTSFESPPGNRLKREEILFHLLSFSRRARDFRIRDHLVLLLRLADPAALSDQKYRSHLCLPCIPVVLYDL